MSRSILTRTAPLLVCVALAACSAPTSTASSGETAPTSPTQPPAATAPTATAGTTAPADAPAGGTITFTGTLSGTMTLSSCPDGGPAQLVVSVDGEKRTYAGVIDRDDFAFVGPGSSGYTLDQKAAKPRVAGGTYTVRKTKLVGVFDDAAAVTADGSVTCP